MKLNHRKIGILFLVLILFQCSGTGQDNAALFKKYCGSCHTIGGGKLVGPDLGGVTARRNKDWIRKFVLNSSEMVRSGDQEAMAVTKTFNNIIMPSFPGNSAELTSVLSYLETNSGTPALGAARDTFLLAATTTNINRGRELFTGMSGFSNSGPSCITCHSVRDIKGIGGALAKNLNLSWFTIKGAGIKSMMQAPAFPAMINAYGNKPLTEGEIYDVAAFLKHNSGVFLIQPGPEKVSGFYIIGLSGCLSATILLLLLWRRRKRDSVNLSIFSRQIKARL